MTTESKKLTSLDEYILLGKSGLRISPLCLGTMTFGQDWAFGNNSEECRKVFDLYREKGGNFFDTANNYTNGTSERFLGEYIQGVRSQVVVATKYTANPESGAWLRGQPVPHPNPNGGGNHKKSLVENVDASLKRLGVDSMDLLYLHFWEFSTPIDQVMRSLDDVVRSGKAYHVAISDAPAWIISQANTIADFRGWSPFVGLQTRYNLIDRSFEFEFQPMVSSFGMSVMPWGCLAEGFLTGKHSKEKTDEASGRKDSVKGHLSNQRNEKILEQVVKISQEVGKSPAAVSLNWMLQKKGVSSPIIGARNVQQLEDNLSALEFTLTTEQMKALDEVSAPVAVPFPNNMASRLSGFADAGAKVRRNALI